MHISEGLIDQIEIGKSWLAGFTRYKSIVPDIPGSYVAFDSRYDSSIGEFRVGLDLKEDGGYPQPTADDDPKP
jgi:hypothetical protein